MATYNLVEAGAAVGRTKSAILKAIQRGTISATRDAVSGGWAIEPAELHRVFPPVSRETSGNHRDTEDTGELRELRARLADAQETIADLRHRLDRADERLLTLLTDQRAAPPPPARRPWWPWKRRG